jgi:hypothetical protein
MMPMCSHRTIIMAIDTFHRSLRAIIPSRVAVSESSKTRYVGAVLQIDCRALLIYTLAMVLDVAVAALARLAALAGDDWPG